MVAATICDVEAQVRVGFGQFPAGLDVDVGDLLERFGHGRVVGLPVVVAGCRHGLSATGAARQACRGHWVCVSRSARAADGVESTRSAWMNQVPTASPRPAATFPDGEGSSAPVSAAANSSSLSPVTSKISVTVSSRRSSASRPAWRSLAPSATLRRRPWRTVAGFGHLGAAGVQRWDTLPLYETCPAFPASREGGEKRTSSSGLRGSR